ncbi:MAG: SdpI family protein [Raoultibacter sp.]|jgi:uncharacterized membrane protein
MNKDLLWITSLLCLLPIIFSVVVYSSLPEQIAIHWNSAGTPDNYAHKAVAAFGLPVVFLAINLFSKARLLNDPKEAGQSQAIRQVGIWLIPILSIVLVPVTLSIAMGANIPIVLLCTLVVGILLIIIGNYLPKSRQSYTFGIKLPWTLADADNWNKTHRLAGYLYIAGGALLIGSNFLLSNAAAQISVTVMIVVVLVVIPIIYSYTQYAHGKAK